jgi:hypothetical protein
MRFSMRSSRLLLEQIFPHEAHQLLSLAISNKVLPHPLLSLEWNIHKFFCFS